MSVATSNLGLCSATNDAVDQASIPALLFRDTVLIVALVGVVLAIDAWLTSFENIWFTILSGLIAFPAGFKANTIFHEWGHFTGARMLGGHAPTNKFSQLFPMFHFDISNSTHRQFMGMSYGGTITEWLFPLLLLLTIGAETIGHAALITGAVAIALVGFLVEAPIIRDALRTNGAEAWAYHMSVRTERFQRMKLIGVPLVIATFVALVI